MGSELGHISAKYKIKMRFTVLHSTNVNYDVKRESFGPFWSEHFWFCYWIFEVRKRADRIGCCWLQGSTIGVWPWAKLLKFEKQVAAAIFLLKKLAFCKIPIDWKWRTTSLEAKSTAKVETTEKFCNAGRVAEKKIIGPHFMYYHSSFISGKILTVGRLRP